MAQTCNIAYPRALLEAVHAPDAPAWLRGAGRSLYPLLRSGDSVRVLRCAPEELARGDVALVRMGRQLVAHVVMENIGKGMPLFRLEDSFERDGLHIHRYGLVMRPYAEAVSPSARERR